MNMLSLKLKTNPSPMGSNRIQLPIVLNSRNATMTGSFGSSTVKWLPTNCQTQPAGVQAFHLFPQLRHVTNVVIGSSALLVCIW